MPLKPMDRPCQVHPRPAVRQFRPPLQVLLRSHVLSLLIRRPTLHLILRHQQLQYCHLPYQICHYLIVLPRRLLFALLQDLLSLLVRLQRPSYLVRFSPCLYTPQLSPPPLHPSNLQNVCSMSAPALRLLDLALQTLRLHLVQARPARHQRPRRPSCGQILPFVHGPYQVMAAPAARVVAVIPISAMSPSQVMFNQDHRPA